jgi:hypothetical protein
MVKKVGILFGWAIEYVIIPVDYKGMIVHALIV